jgi:Spy/CpxP family protein refolding chaperone
MRKTLIVGLGLALGLAGSVAAQAPGAGAPRRDRADVHRGHVGRPGIARFDRGHVGPARFLLRGITLTEAQKGQLKTLRESQRETMPANRGELRKQMQEARAARQRGDTAAAKAIVQRQRDAMAKSREQQLAAIRNILTAEQRLQFDKNASELEDRAAKRAEHRRGQKMFRGGTRGL